MNTLNREKLRKTKTESKQKGNRALTINEREGKGRGCDERRSKRKNAANKKEKNRREVSMTSGEKFALAENKHKI